MGGGREGDRSPSRVEMKQLEAQLMMRSYEGFLK
jgi:hypothetical protein